MTRIVGVVAISAVALFGKPAFADCVLWDLNGRWEFWQSNKAKATFDLQQDTAGKIKGNGHYEREGPDKIGTSFGEAGSGPVTGEMVGNRFTFVAKWQEGKDGTYSGDVGPDGQLSGVTSDLQRPAAKATWHEWAGRRAKCMTAQTSPSSAINPKYQQNTDMPGKDYRGFDTKKGGVAECQITCSKEHKCQAWTWSKQINRCWLKDALPVAVLDDCCISGVKSKIVMAQGKAAKPPGKVIKAIGPAKVDHDVDIFDRPVVPRRVLGTMLAGGKGRAVEHHQDGWCRLENIDRSDPPTLKAGWVAEDHFTSGKCPVQ